MGRPGEVFFVLINITLLVGGAPAGEESSDLVRYENVHTADGYRFSYETKDGVQVREEVGVIDALSGVLRVTGWYSFRAPDGATYRVDFVADENGYRPTEPPTAVLVQQVLPPPSLGSPLHSAALLSLVG